MTNEPVTGNKLDTANRLADIATKRGIDKLTNKQQTEANTEAPVAVGKAASNEVAFSGDNGEQLIYLLPEDIEVPEESMDVRPYTNKFGGGDQETDAITRMAASIEKVGQILPVRVRYGTKGQYILVDGRRRTMAIGMVNAGKEKGAEPMRVSCVIGKDDMSKMSKVLGKAHRRSMMANIHAARMNPMDMAEDIRRLREQYKWTGSQGTNNIAEYLQVSPATVIQYEKFLKLDKEHQESIYNGTISLDAAFVLVNVAPAKRDEVLAKAKELDEKEKEVHAEKVVEAATGSEPENSALSRAIQNTRGKRAPRTTTGIKGRHVKEAARQVEGATTHKTSRSKKEIVEFMDALEGPISGHADGLPHIFLREFHAYAGGGSSDKKLEKTWLELIARAPKGSSKPDTKPPVTKLPVKKDATKKK
jgi:ParB-like chromosome segregation protein Spo0J